MSAYDDYCFCGHNRHAHTADDDSEDVSACRKSSCNCTEYTENSYDHGEEISYLRKQLLERDRTINRLTAKKEREANERQAR